MILVYFTVHRLIFRSFEVRFVNLPEFQGVHKYKTVNIILLTRLVEVVSIFQQNQLTGRHNFRKC